MTTTLKLVGIAVVLAVVLTLAGLSLNAAKWRGIAEVYGAQADTLRDSLVVLKASTAALEAEKARADSLAEARRFGDSLRIAELSREAQRAELRADSVLEHLEGAIDPGLLPELRDLVAAQETRIASLEESLAIERERTAAERMRADAGDALILQLQATVTTLEAENLALRSQVAALKQARSPGLGVQLGAGKWLFVAGVAVGVLGDDIAEVLQRRRH